MAIVQEQLIALGGEFEAEFETDEGMGFGGVPTPMPALFTYDDSNPYAVDIKFLGVENFNVTLEREQLFIGRFQLTGIEGLRILPNPEMGGTVIAQVQGAKARIAMVQTSELSSFLSKTQQLVPLGKEQMEISDEMLNQLLDEGK